MTRRMVEGLLLLAIVCASCQSQPTPSASHETVVVTPMPSALSSTTPQERIVGGLVVHERPATTMQPSLTPGQAQAIVEGEIRAGRARVIGYGVGIPPLRVVERAFSSGVTGVLNTQGGPVFESAEPIPGWVVVLGGVGADGEYLVVGVVDDSSGTPLVVEVFTPGS